MEKILLVLNAHQPNSRDIEFACRMAGIAGTPLTGLFVENIYNEPQPVLPGEGGYYQSVLSSKAAVVMDTGEAVHLFREACRLRQVDAIVRVEQGEPIQEVLRESRFADLLVMNPALHFYDDENALPTHFVREMLFNAECPVLLTPETCTDIEQIVFCYDGSDSAAFAIKQFTYLLPEFKKTDILLLQVRKWPDAEENSQADMLSWLQVHYQHVDVTVLAGRAPDELINFLFLKSGRLLVMGAYGRNVLSTFFRRSNADVLIRAADLPIFITHR